MILSKRNFLIGATASLGIIAAPAIVRCESLMAIKAIENTRYVTFLEAIYLGSPWEYMASIPRGMEFDNLNGWCHDPGSQEIRIKPHMYNVNKLQDFLCNKMIMPV